MMWIWASSILQLTRRVRKKICLCFRGTSCTYGSFGRGKSRIPGSSWDRIKSLTEFPKSGTHLIPVPRSVFNASHIGPLQGGKKANIRPQSESDRNLLEFSHSATESTHISIIFSLCFMFLFKIPQLVAR